MIGRRGSESARRAENDEGRAAEAGLVARLAGGDPDALRGAYDLHGSFVFSVAMRLLGDPGAAEECTQDVFMTLWREAGSFDPNRSRLTTWLYVVARNRAITLDRRRRARPATPVADPPEVASEADPAVDVIREEDGRMVAEALGELPVEQFEVITLAYFEELTQEEIAARLGIPLGTVKGRVRLGLDRLRRVLPADAVSGGPR